MHVLIGSTRLELIEGDIAEQDTDGVVTAAHWDLRGGQGTDGAIHFKAGPQLLEACARIGGCPIGDAVLTEGFSLPARYVIHAVGPVYDEGNEQEAEFLSGAYRNSLRVAVENGLESISFPSISTGAFCFPLTLAAPIALQAIVSFLRSEAHSLKLVRVVLYPNEQPQAFGIYAEALREIPLYAVEDFQDLPFEVSRHTEALKSFAALNLAPESIRPALRARELVFVRVPSCTFRIGVTVDPELHEKCEIGNGSIAFEQIYQADDPTQAAHIRDEVERYFLRHYPGRTLSGSQVTRATNPTGNYVYVICYPSED